MISRGSLFLAAVMAASALMFVPAAPAQAGKQKLGRTVLVGGNAAHRRKYQRWIDAARVNVKMPRTKVLFRESNCPDTSGIAACVIAPRFFATKLRFYIPRVLLTPQYYDPVDTKNTVLHELGHVYDFKYNDDHHRGGWLAIFGIPGPFYSDEKNPPYEKFAVGYSYCAAGFSYERALTRFEFDVYEHTFTPEQYAATCAMLKPAPKPPA